MPNFIIKNLHVCAKGEKIIFGVDFLIRPGEICALMGPNGSGKSTLAYALAGHPYYTITQGDVLLGQTSIKNLKPEERSQRGLFLSFQEPPEIGGVPAGVFLKKLVSVHEPSKKNRVYTIHQAKILMQNLSPKKDLLERYVNKDFSGGEKKKSEMLQLAAIQPKFAVLDEIDSGLDVDSLHTVAETIREMAKKGIGFLLISHYTKLFHILRPSTVLVMYNGRIVKKDTAKILKHIDTYGFKKFEDH